MELSFWREGPISIDQQTLEADVLAREISGRAAMEVNTSEWSLSGLSNLLVSTPPQSQKSPPPLDTSSVQYETVRKDAIADKECALSTLPLATTAAADSPRCSVQNAGVPRSSAPHLLLRALGAAEEASARRIAQQARRCAEKGEGTPLRITQSFGAKLEWSDFPSLGPNSSVTCGVIRAISLYIQRNSSALFVMDPQFWPSLRIQRPRKVGIDVDKGRRFAQRNRTSLRAADIIAAPLHRPNHWTLALVDVRRGCILHYDPKGQAYSGRADERLSDLHDWLVECWAPLVTSDGAQHPYHWRIADVLSTARYPIQPAGDTSSCGLFVLGVLACVGQNTFPTFSADDVAHMRRVLTLLLVAGSDRCPPSLHTFLDPPYERKQASGSSTPGPVQPHRKIAEHLPDSRCDDSSSCHSGRVRPSPTARPFVCAIPKPARLGRVGHIRHRSSEHVASELLSPKARKTTTMSDPSQSEQSILVDQVAAAKSPPPPPPPPPISSLSASPSTSPRSASPTLCRDTEEANVSQTDLRTYRSARIAQILCAFMSKRFDEATEVAVHDLSLPLRTTMTDVHHDVSDLEKSMREYGFRRDQPLLVWRAGEHHIVISGRRRYRAASRIATLHTVWAHIIDNGYPPTAHDVQYARLYWQNLEEQQQQQHCERTLPRHRQAVEKVLEIAFLLRSIQYASGPIASHTGGGVSSRDVRDIRKRELIRNLPGDTSKCRHWWSALHPSVQSKYLGVARFLETYALTPTLLSVLDKNKGLQDITITRLDGIRRSVELEGGQCRARVAHLFEARIKVFPRPINSKQHQQEHQQQQTSDASLDVNGKRDRGRTAQKAGPGVRTPLRKSEMRKLLSNTNGLIQLYEGIFTKSNSTRCKHFLRSLRELCRSAIELVERGDGLLLAAGTRDEEYTGQIYRPWILGGVGVDMGAPPPLPPPPLPARRHGRDPVN